jgi:acetoin utilization protein AcuC
MDASLVYSPAMAAYDLGPEHPLRPERFTLAVALMEAYGLLAPAGASVRGRLSVVEPVPATDAELELVHAASYIAAVREASGHPEWFLTPRWGLGTADTPVFPGMHDVSALIAGATLTAMRMVLAGPCRRAFSIAGGLHHAHRDRAAGFCVYNDCAVAIASALVSEPDLRVLYLDIDAHHGDGVQEAFYQEPRVLTVSIHETGERLYPGTGVPRERGAGRGEGFAVNVPLPEGATDACYHRVFERVVEPLTRRFAPDLIVAQCGADAHHDDPLTSLGMTVRGHDELVGRILGLAFETAHGRVVACGGGGYGWEHVVPRIWTSLAARLADHTLDERLPETWRELARTTSRVVPPATLHEDDYAVYPSTEARLMELTERACDEVVGSGTS